MPRATVTDAKQIIRAKLLADSALAAVVADRIYGHHPVDYDNLTTQMPLVIVEIDGGTGRHNTSIQRLRVYIYAYSAESAAQAAKVADLIDEALHAEELQVGNVAASGTCEKVNEPAEGYNEEVRGFFARTTYSLFTVS